MPVRCERGYAVLEDISSTGVRLMTDFGAEEGERLRFEVCDRGGELTPLHAIVCRTSETQMGHRIACRLDEEPQTEASARRLYEAVVAAARG